MEDRNRNERPWYYWWLAFIGGIVVFLGACYGLYLGGRFIWMQGYDTKEYEMSAELKKSKFAYQQLDHSFYLSVRVLKAIHDKPEDFSLDGKCDLAHTLNNNKYEFMDSGVRFGEYVFEFERDSSGAITGLKEPVHFNEFRARTR